MCAVANMAVVCTFLVLCFIGMLLRYILSDFGTVLVAAVVTGLMVVFRHVHEIVKREFYLRHISPFSRPSVRLSFRIEQLGSQWTDFD
jgi:hypothetical protein